MNDLKTFIFIGRSGCGKGTQIDLLTKHYTDNGEISAEKPLLRSESGGRFRAFVQTESYTSHLAKTSMEAGGRLPDSLAIWNWMGYLIENYTGKEHLAFDGSPRSLLEAKAIDTMIKFYNRSKPVVIYLDVSYEESKRRLLERGKASGRADDMSDEEVSRRLDWFDTDVLPAVEYYEKNSDYQFLQINGEQTREKIHEDIVQELTQN